jgi:hypothetical protein
MVLFCVCQEQNPKQWGIGSKANWLFFHGCLWSGNGRPWGLGKASQNLVSQKQDPASSPMTFLLLGDFSLGQTYISGFFSQLTICKLLTNFHRRFNQIKQVVAPWVSSFLPQLIAATDDLLISYEQFLQKKSYWVTSLGWVLSVTRVNIIFLYSSYVGVRRKKVL